MSQQPDPQTLGPTLAGHPIALFVLVFTGACEHFAFFGVRGLLVFYFSDPLGPCWDLTEVLTLFSAFSLGTYATYIPGGFIADRITGARRGALTGGLLFCVGCLLLAYPETRSSYLGLVFIAVGVGLMRPALWTLVGRVYAPGDARRDMGFSVLFVGINLGAALSGLFVVSIGHSYGWSYGFGLAAGVLLLGLGVFALGSRYLSEPPRIKEAVRRPLTNVEVQRAYVIGVAALVISLSSTMYNFATEAMFGLARDAAASWVYSLDSVFVFFMALPVAYAWVVLKRRGHEPSALFKIALGIILTGVGLLFTVPLLMQDGGEPWLGWLALPRLMAGLGSLFIVPVAWSFVSKLAPLKYASTLMGAFLASSALLSTLAYVITNGLGSGYLFNNPSLVILGTAVFCSFVGLIVIAALKSLNPLTHGAEEGHTVPTSAGHDEGEATTSAGVRALIFIAFLLIANAVLAAVDAPFWIY